MKDSDVIFNMIFGWSMVVIAVLLIAVLVVYIKSLLVFKNAKVIKGKVVDLNQIGILFDIMRIKTIKSASYGLLKVISPLEKQ